jgi:hypothetical protein
MSEKTKYPIPSFSEIFEINKSIYKDRLDRLIPLFKKEMENIYRVALQDINDFERAYGSFNEVLRGLNNYLGVPVRGKEGNIYSFGLVDNEKVTDEKSLIENSYIMLVPFAEFKNDPYQSGFVEYSIPMGNIILRRKSDKLITYILSINTRVRPKIERINDEENKIFKIKISMKAGHSYQVWCALYTMLVHENCMQAQGLKRKKEHKKNTILNRVNKYIKEKYYLFHNKKRVKSKFKEFEKLLEV